MDGIEELHSRCRQLGHIPFQIEAWFARILSLEWLQVDSSIRYWQQIEKLLR